jgi:hypothetical protein
MSNDDLLRALGGLAARQDREQPPLPPELTSPPRPMTRQHLAEQALAALAPGARAARVDSPGWAARLLGRRSLLLATPALGVAAVAAVMFMRGQAPLLPPYTLEVRGGVASLRGDPAAGAPLQVAGGSRVELRLRPAQAIDPGGVEVEVSWARDGRQVPWDAATTEISDQGAVRLAGAAPGSIGPGDGEVVIRLRRPGGRWQTLRAPVRWQ